MSLIYQAAASNTNASTRHQSNTRTRPGLYLGGKVHAKNLDKLKRWNVTHILNLTPMKQSGIQVSLYCPVRIEKIEVLWVKVK